MNSPIEQFEKSTEEILSTPQSEKRTCCKASCKSASESESDDDDEE